MTKMSGPLPGFFSFLAPEKTSGSGGVCQVGLGVMGCVGWTDCGNGDWAGAGFGSWAACGRLRRDGGSVTIRPYAHRVGVRRRGRCEQWGGGFGGRGRFGLGRSSGLFGDGCGGFVEAEDAGGTLVLVGFRGWGHNAGRVVVRVFWFRHGGSLRFFRSGCSRLRRDGGILSHGCRGRFNYRHGGRFRLFRARGHGHLGRLIGRVGLDAHRRTAGRAEFRIGIGNRLATISTEHNGLPFYQYNFPGAHM